MPDIFDEISESEGDIFDSLTPEKSSALKTAGKTATQFAKSAATGLSGTYGDILDLIGLAPKRNLTEGQKALYEAEFNAPESQLGHFQDEDIIPRYSRLPKSEEISEFIGENNPESLPERYAQRAGRAVGSGASLGASPASLAQLGAVTGIGQSAIELGAPEWVGSALELGTLLTPASLAKNVPAKKELKRFVEFAREKGLNESEIAGLLQGQKKMASLGKLAKKSGKTEQLLKNIEQKAGGAFDTIKTESANLPRLTGEQSGKLGDSFGEIMKDLGTTVKASPEKEKAINFIREAYENLMNRGATPEELINFYQDVNSSVNWNAIKGGKKSLSRLKEPIMEALAEASPQLAEDFNLTNTLYSRYKNLAKSLKPNMVDKYLDKGYGAAAIFSVATGNPGLIGAYFTTDVARRIGRQLLFNPRLNNISEKMLNAINNDKPKLAESLFKLFKKEAEKEDPDIFSDVKD